MSILDYKVRSDKFEPAQAMLLFPCLACIHANKASNSEPCNSCGHNLTATKLDKEEKDE